jgi:hypothetical protein
VKVRTVEHHSPPNSFESQFHAVKAIVFGLVRIIQTANCFFQEDHSHFAGFPLLVYFVTSAFLLAQFVYAKCVSGPPMDPILGKGLPRQVTVEDGVAHMGRVAGTFYLVEQVADCKG